MILKLNISLSSAYVKASYITAFFFFTPFECEPFPRDLQKLFTAVTSVELRENMQLLASLATSLIFTLTVDCCSDPHLRSV